jgi:RNA polymerase sigma factor (TIGR02999 family)
MNDVTQLLSAIQDGDPAAASQLLPLVYDELRRLAAQKLAHENPGQTLQPTALVHEAYLRLVGSENPPGAWEGRGHFFAAAAEAMRRILVENARRKHRQKRGGGCTRQSLDPDQVAAPEVSEDLLALDEALTKLAASDPRVAQLVQLRYFGGLTIKQAAEVLNISTRTANADWAYARSWLLATIRGDDV